MADPATPPAASDEGKGDSSADEKKKKAPKPKFGQILNLGSGRMWTVESSEGGSVTIMQRDGNEMTRRQLTEDEYGAARENPLPSEYQRSKPPRGLTIGMYLDAGRVVGYDAATGEIQFEGPKGISWAPGKSLFGGGSGALDRDSSEGGGGGLAIVGSRSAKGGETEQEGGVIHRAVGGFLAKNVKDLTGGLVDLNKPKKTTSSETGAPAATPVVVPQTPIPTSTPSREISEELLPEEQEEEIKVDPAVGLVETILRTWSGDVLKYIDEQAISEDVLKSEAVQGAVLRRLVNDFESRDPSAALELAVRTGVSANQIRVAAEKATEYYANKNFDEFPELREKFERSMEPVKGYLSKSEPATAKIQSTPSVSVSRTIVVGGAPVEKEKPVKPSVVVSRIIPVGEAAVEMETKSKPAKPGKSSVTVSKTIAVGGAAAATAAVAGTVAVTASVASAAPAAASAAPAAATVSVKAKVSVPSIRETREQMRGAMESVTARAKALYSAPAPSKVRGGDQQQLYARAADALQIMGSRVASQRAAIQDLQGEATVLRDEIAGLNAQAAGQAAGQASGPFRAPSEISERIQTASKKLGNTNNRLALSRFNLQADEARVQQLQIGTKLMRNAAPEVAAGRMPAFVVGMVERSIPEDIPPPSPARAAALVASMQEPQGEDIVEPSPVTVPTAPRSYSAIPPTELGRGQKPSRGVSLRRNLTLPPSTSDFLSAQQADRGTGYIPGVGSPDARQAALASSGAESDLSVLRQKRGPSYTDVPKAEEAEDIYTGGGGAASREFAEKTREQSAMQALFSGGPKTEGLPETTFEKETDRAQSVRNEPQPEDLAAAAFNAAQQQTRAASMQASLAEGEEEAKKSGAASTLKALKQTESVRRNVARMFDLFNAALGAATAVTVLGALMEIVELLLSMNGRVLSAMLLRNPRSVVRKFLPVAQFPYEFAAIIALDFIIFTFIFLSVCLTLMPLLIGIAILVLGVGGVITVAT